MNHRSPAKVLRRITKFIEQKDKALPPVISEPIRTTLNFSPTVFTNFPDAFSVCELHQCETDLGHSLDFAITKSLENTFAKAIEET